MTERNPGLLSLSLDSRALSQIGRAFDDAWAAISANYAEFEKDEGRMQLATIILGFAADRSRDWEQVKAAALAFFTSSRSPADVLH